MHITELQKSALQEAGNIGAGHAAIALSQLIGKKIMIAIPTVKVYKTSDIRNAIDYKNTNLIFIGLGIYGDIDGFMVLVMKEQLAFLLCDIALGREKGNTMGIKTLEQSTLDEIGNILASSYLNAISTMTKLSICISAPEFESGDIDSITSLIIKNKINLKEVESIISISTEFTEESTTIEGQLIFIPVDKAVEKIIKAFNI